MSYSSSIFISRVSGAGVESFGGSGYLVLRGKSAWYLLVNCIFGGMTAFVFLEGLMLTAGWASDTSW